MPQNHQNSLLFPALQSISKLLQEDDVQGMIIGGLAASLLGRPRYTNDIDLLILDLDNRLPEFIKKLKNLGSDQESNIRKTLQKSLGCF